MLRSTVLFLTVALLVACSTVSLQADPGPWRKDAGPWYALSWSGVPEDCRNVVPMIFVTRGRKYPDGRVWKPATDPGEAAKQSLNKPKGRAAILLYDHYRDPNLLAHPEDVCRTPDGKPTKHIGIWPDKGVELIGRRVDEFFGAYKKAGGRLDYVGTNYRGGYFNWSKKPEWFEAVEEDPRSEDLKRQLKFRDFKSITVLGNKRYLTWNAVVDVLKDQAMNKAVFDIVRRHYPEADGSNYESHILDRSHVVPERNGHMQHRSSYAGTAQSRGFYGTYKALAKLKLDGRNPYGLAPVNVLRWHINMARGIRASSEAPFHPWLVHKNHKDSWFRDNELYREYVLHLAMYADEVILLFNPELPQFGRRDAHDRLFDALIGRLNEIVGHGDRRVADASLIPWDCSILISGIETPKRKVWRVTAVSVDGQKIEPVRGKFAGNTYTLFHDRWELLLRGAKPVVVENPVATAGVWIETAAAVRPVLRKR